LRARAREVLRAAGEAIPADLQAGNLERAAVGQQAQVQPVAAQGQATEEQPQVQPVAAQGQAAEQAEQGCRDQSPQCSVYVAHNFCDSKVVFIAGTPVWQVCPASCGRCSPVVATTLPAPASAPTAPASAPAAAPASPSESESSFAVVVPTGTCQDHSCKDMSNFGLCEAANAKLGLGGAVQMMNYPGVPGGCIKSKSGITYFNKAPSSAPANSWYEKVCSCYISPEEKRNAEVTAALERSDKADYIKGCVDEDPAFCADAATAGGRSCTGPYFYHGKRVSRFCSKTCNTCNAAQLRGTAAKLQKSIAMQLIQH